MQKIMELVTILVHGLGFVTFLGLLWPTLTRWKDSIKWLNFLSIYAILSTHALGFADAFQKWISHM